MTLTDFLSRLTFSTNNTRPPNEITATLFLDEPTAHLPTAAARNFLPALQRHLPQTRIVAAMRRAEDANYDQ